MFKCSFSSIVYVPHRLASKRSGIKIKAMFGLREGKRRENNKERESKERKNIIFLPSVWM